VFNLGSSTDVTGTGLSNSFKMPFCLHCDSVRQVEPEYRSHSPNIGQVAGGFDRPFRSLTVHNCNGSVSYARRNATSKDRLMRPVKREIPTYTLIAYESSSGAEVFKWKNVGDIPEKNRPTMGDVLTDDKGARWRVVGVRKTSSAKAHYVDVQKIV
jgi:hypothetical protein